MESLGKSRTVEFEVLNGYTTLAGNVKIKTAYGGVAYSQQERPEDP
jgi:heme-binding NEAT domain protein